MAPPPRSPRPFADASPSPAYRRDRRPRQLLLDPSFEKPSAALDPITRERLRLLASAAAKDRQGHRRRRTPGSRNFIYGSTDA